jgi:hypothetical protein
LKARDQDRPDNLLIVGNHGKPLGGSLAQLAPPRSVMIVLAQAFVFVGGTDDQKGLVARIASFLICCMIQGLHVVAVPDQLVNPVSRSDVARSQ